MHRDDKAGALNYYAQALALDPIHLSMTQVTLFVRDLPPPPPPLQSPPPPPPPLGPSLPLSLSFFLPPALSSPFSLPPSVPSFLSCFPRSLYLSRFRGLCVCRFSCVCLSRARTCKDSCKDLQRHALVQQESKGKQGRGVGWCASCVAGLGVHSTLKA